MKRQLPPCPGGVYWEVAYGDTLYEIARATNVPLKVLIAANPNVNPQNLQVGQQICIPDCPSGVFWEVAPGDTLYKISQATKIPLERILAVNPGIEPENLQIGQFICLPE